MDNVYKLEGAYVIASPDSPQELLRGALIYIYQVDQGIVSGIIVNKPFESPKTLGDYLEYPKSALSKPVWQGGPAVPDRLIAFSQYNRDIYITDRLLNLTQDQIDNCLFVVGQCIWPISVFLSNIRSGDFWVVGSPFLIPNQVPAEHRIPYLLKTSGINQQKCVPQVEHEAL